MIKIIVATETEGLETTNLVIALDVIRDDLNIEEAVMDACKEYCRTEEGQRVFKVNGCNFNWGDFDAYVPNDICASYGFTKIVSNIADEFDFNQQLVDEEEIFSDDEM